MVSSKAFAQNFSLLLLNYTSVITLVSLELDTDFLKSSLSSQTQKFLSTQWEIKQNKILDSDQYALLVPHVVLGDVVTLSHLRNRLLVNYSELLRWNTVLSSQLLPLQIFEGVCPGYLESLQMPPTRGRNYLNFFQHIPGWFMRINTHYLITYIQSENYRRAIHTACSSFMI